MQKGSVRSIVFRVTLAVFMLSLTPAARALDINGDGLDDIWQELYNIAHFDGHGDPDNDGLINLIESLSWSDPHVAGSASTFVYITDLDPPDGIDDFWQAIHGIYPDPPDPLNLTQPEKVADPDGDLRTNLEESIVGSDPFTADNPWEHIPAGAGVGSDGPDSFTLSLGRTDPAMRYQLQSTEDLVTWTSVWGIEFIGDGQPWGITLDTTGLPRQFYRFVLDQPDDDSDGLINWHEWILGTDPYNADSDGDGLMDGWEVVHGLNAVTQDTDGDGTADDQDVSPLDPDFRQPRVSETRYAVFDLTLTGLNEADRVSKVNNSCQLIGDYDEPFFWDNGQRTGILMNWVTDLSNNGVVSGNSLFQDLDYNTFVARWTLGQSYPELLYGYEPPLIGGETLDQPVFVSEGGINDSGTIVGGSSAFIEHSNRDPANPDTSLLYSCGTIWNGTTRAVVGQVAFGLPSDSLDICDPLDLNNAGVIVGSMANGPYDAFVSEGAAVTRLPRVVTPPPYDGVGPYPWASHINQAGTVAAGGMMHSHPVAWVKNQTAWKAKNLGSYDPASQANAFVAGGTFGMNERLEFIGNYWGAGNVSGQLWQNGKIVDLQTRISSKWKLIGAHCINDKGVIGVDVRATNASGVPIGAVHPALLLPFEVKSVSIPYLDGDSKPLPKSGSADNLLAVWSDGPKATEVTIKLTLPSDLVLPPNFITWAAEDYTTPIAPNTKVWTFNWHGKVGRKKITIELPTANRRQFIYVDVPNVGTLSEEKAKRDLRNLDKLAGLWIASDWARIWSEAIIGKSPAERNALKHAYWNALGASNVAIGKAFTLQYTTAHEYSNKVKDQGNSDSKLGAYNNTMDIFNNDVGANTVFTKQHLQKGAVPDADAIRAALLQKLNVGELMIWDGTGDWNSDTTNRFLIKSNKQKYYPSDEIIP